jgi:hypothetical protein
MDRSRGLRTYVVTKLGDDWVLFRSDDTADVYVCGFMEGWLRARALAAATTPSVVVALNVEGELVARECFGLAS